MDRVEVWEPPLCPESFVDEVLVDEVLVERHTDQLLDELMNIAEQLLEEGRQRGLAEGRRTTVLKLLTKRFGSLPVEVVARVMVAEDEDLDGWLDRLLTVPTLAEVLA